MSQDWLTQRERSSVFALRLLAWIARILGRRVARVVLYPVCAYFLLFSSTARTASRRYLSRVLGRAAGMRDVFRHYHTFATVALDRVYLLQDRLDLFDVLLHNEEVLARHLACGEACLLLGAHLGSFEVVGAFGRGRGLRVALVMYEDNARMIQAVTRAINPAWGESVIGLGRLDSMLKVQQRVEAGEWVGMLGDRALDEEGRVAATFFGEKATWPIAPFRLAAMLGRPVVLMVGLYRGGNRYELYFEQLVASSAFEHGRRDAQLEEWVTLYAQRLEHYCRLAPFNWFNFYDFWASDGSRAPDVRREGANVRREA